MSLPLFSLEAPDGSLSSALLILPPGVDPKWGVPAIDLAGVAGMERTSFMRLSLTLLAV